MNKESLKYMPESAKKQLADAKYGSYKAEKGSKGAVDKGLGAWQTWNKVTFVGAGIGWVAVPALAPLWATSMAIDGTQIFVIDKVRKKKAEKAGAQMKEEVVFDAKKAPNASQKQYALAA